MCEYTSKHPVLQTPKREWRQTAALSDGPLGEYVKWKLSYDLVICQVSRDKEDEEGERPERG